MVVSKNVILSLVVVAGASFVGGVITERVLKKDKLSLLRDDLDNMMISDLDNGEFIKRCCDLIVDTAGENSYDKFYDKAAYLCDYIIKEHNKQSHEKYAKKCEAVMEALKKAEEEAAESEEE